MIKPHLLRTMRFSAVLAVMLSLGGLATSAYGSLLLNFNPTGGGIGGTAANFGNIPITTVDELPGNAIARGFTPTVGSTFTLDYQANVGSLLNANVNPSTVFTYGTGAPSNLNSNTGQLTVVATFTEQVTGVSNNTATFTTTGVGNLTYYFNPNRIANDLAGTGFAPFTTGNPPGSDAAFVPVYQGTILPGATGNFTNNGLANPPALDQAGDNNYPAVNTVSGNGSTLLNIQTASYDSRFFTNAPPASQLLQLFNTSNNLPFAQVNPSAIFYNNQPGVASVGPINGNPTPGAANVMFQADANSSFAAVPEPGSISMAMTGLGLVSLGVLRARRRRSV